MEALLGFDLDFWDYVTFASMSVIVLGGLGAAVFILGLPGRIAIARGHPEAEAVYLMGWVGFLAVVPWIQALGRAFRPTDVIDVRHLPAERKRETDEMIARLTHQTRLGQRVEVALHLYPGQIFTGRVDSIWKGNGVGQYLPSDDIPKFQAPPPNVAEGQYAVKIILDDPDQSKFPIGAQGSAAIYTSGERGAWATLRKISLRAHSWANWLYPMSF